MIKKTGLFVALLCGAISAPLVTSIPAHGNNHEAKQQKLIEAAKKDRRVKHHCRLGAHRSDRHF